MRLIAEGRASEVFDLGDGSVLRRFKTGGDPEREALVMRHARSAGYPVPRVVDVTADALVLERMDGPTMLDVVILKPWLLRRHARTLARLHEQLHELDAPAGLSSAGPGDRLIHFDLHPANVILSRGGPVVIDWTNAQRGEPALDVAMTWVIMATSAAGLLVQLFLRRFLSYFERGDIVLALPAAAGLRVADPNVPASEREAVRHLVERITSRRWP
jgi:aminoglycoside phosphotransferase (APT) family kinase protein